MVVTHRRRRPLASPAARWVRSSGRHAPRSRLESGDPSSPEIAKKSWAESLRPTHSLYLFDFRDVTPTLDRPPPRRRRWDCLVFLGGAAFSALLSLGQLGGAAAPRQQPLAVAVDHARRLPAPGLQDGR